jgi:hypothetical protein|tara:strand:+ start:1596 stop:2420 length:825 start_codon:yes stop_codon:yes gene_type:complete
MTVVTGHWSAADAMDASRMNSTVLQQNTFSNRPASDTGLAGKMFYATDTGRLYVQTSGGWEEVFPNDAAAGVGSKRTLGTGSTQAAPGQHASAHEPGGGDAMAVNAAAGTGSLRSLGTSSTTAAAGNHTHTPSVASAASTQQDEPGAVSITVAKAYDDDIQDAYGTANQITTAVTPGASTDRVIVVASAAINKVSATNNYTHGLRILNHSDAQIAEDTLGPSTDANTVSQLLCAGNETGVTGANTYKAQPKGGSSTSLQADTIGITIYAAVFTV